MTHLLATAALPHKYFDGLSLGVLLVRVALGLTMAAHGYAKLFTGGRIAGTAKWFDSMGMKPNGRVHAVAAATTEVGAGVLFAVGLLTPLAAAGFVGLMVVAAWTVHRPSGFFIVKGGWEYNFVLAVVPVGIAMVGPGRYSLDWALGLDFAFRSGLAFLLSAALGAVAGVGLLAACYRPSAEQEVGR